MLTRAARPEWPPRLVGEICADWRVIRGTFVAAWFKIHRAGVTAGGECLADEDVINAHAHLAFERIHAVIPPRKDLCLRLEHAHSIAQTDRR